jgi:hypothetical protein
MPRRSTSKSLMLVLIVTLICLPISWRRRLPWLKLLNTTLSWLLVQRKRRMLLAMSVLATMLFMANAPLLPFLTSLNSSPRSSSKLNYPLLSFPQKEDPSSEQKKLSLKILFFSPLRTHISLDFGSHLNWFHSSPTCNYHPPSSPARTRSKRVVGDQKKLILLNLERFRM